MTEKPSLLDAFQSQTEGLITEHTARTKYGITSIQLFKLVQYGMVQRVKVMGVTLYNDAQLKALNGS